MVRAPCCEKMGLKKGPWAPDEDQRLIAHIQKHGHGNWRALPKQAGLLRCGKSCRLRWTNYLRPDIKRGNFSREEEEAIINLHELLGNRWSAIAAKLPGRTDNEIKNVWHTHLKKRLKQHDDQTKKSSCTESHVMGRDQSESEEITSSSVTTHRFEHPILDSPIRCSSSSEHFSGAESPLNVISHEKYDDEMGIKDHDCIVSLENLPQIDDSLMWLQAMPLMDNGLIGVSDEKFTSGLTMVIEQEQKIHDARFPLSPVSNTSTTCGSNMKEDNDFWRDLFREVGELTELPGF